MPGVIVHEFINHQWYSARIEGAATMEANSGALGIMLKWMIVEGENTGKYVIDNHWITKNTADRERELFKKLFDYDIATQDLELVSTLEGAVADIKIVNDEYPKGSNKWKPVVERIREHVEGAPLDLPVSKRIAAFFGTVAAPVEEREPWDQEGKDFGGN